MNWDAFFSGLVGTTVPALVVSAILVSLNYRANKAQDRHRNELSEKLSVLQNDMKKRTEMFAVWHQKRVSALIEIYEAFRVYIAFLRKALYVFPRSEMNMDPMHEFRTTIDRNLVFLDDKLQQQINQFVGELLAFWNWAHRQERPGGFSEDDAVQRRLDFEIPTYLEKLRRIINQHADPTYLDEKPTLDRAQP